MTTVIRWKPDTCGCILLYDVMDGEPSNYRFEKKCAPHQDSDILSVINENKLKNEVFSTLESEIQPDDYKWTFDKDRNLIVEGLTPEQKTKISGFAKVKHV